VGIPGAILWELILPGDPTILFHEDNQAMIQVLNTGRNPTMRHLGRSHRVPVASLHEVFQGTDFELAYEVSSKMAADIYTKAFTDAAKWTVVLELISILDPALLSDVKYMRDLNDSSPSHSGGLPLHLLSLTPTALLAKRVGMRTKKTSCGYL